MKSVKEHLSESLKTFNLRVIFSYKNQHVVAVDDSATLKQQPNTSASCSITE